MRRFRKFFNYLSLRGTVRGIFWYNLKKVEFCRGVGLDYFLDLRMVLNI